MKKNMLNFSTLFAETKKMIIFVPKLVSMNANELRIGNLVYNKHGEVHEIGHNCFNRFRNLIMEGNPSGFQPILLTEEWLMRAGFEKHNWEYDEDASPQNNGDSLFTHITEEGLYISFGRDPMCCVYGYGGIAYIYSVHQLQNLWFALFRKELTINI